MKKNAFKICLIVMTVLLLTSMLSACVVRDKAVEWIGMVDKEGQFVEKVDAFLAYYKEDEIEKFEQKAKAGGKTGLVIAIGGGLSNAGETVVGGIRDTLQKDPGFRMYYSHVRVVPTRFRNDAGILGAAALAVRDQKEEAE